ncbi:MAG: NADPH-dependent FMN reductase [Limisphaerales bacterium]
MSDVKILGIAGSLRKGSYNRALIRTAGQLLPTGTTMETFDLLGIPPFNEDDEENVPQKVQDFKAAIRRADAILISTPEYNYSFSGVLKNAIDWASRPYGDSAWIGKPAAIIGASAGRMGTARAQYHLRQVFVYLQMEAINYPEVMVSNASDNFDQDGKLTHKSSRDSLKELIEALVARTRLLRTAR